MANLFVASGIFHPESGGPATYLREVIPHLQARGWTARLLSYGEATSGTSYPYPVRRISRRALPVRLVDYGWAARPLMEWAEVVYQHSFGLPLIGKRPRVLKVVGDPSWERAIRKGWIPVTTDIDTFQNERYSPFVALDTASRNREAQHADGIIVPSEYLKRMVIGWGVEPGRVRVIYNALPAHDVPTRDRADVRAELGLPDAPTILTVGRIVAWKGIDHLIAAVARLPNVRLLVAGDGDLLEVYRAQAAVSGAADRITFLGQVSRDRMTLYMQAADYLALYSGYEGLSHTLLESLRAGTPVIASNKGGNPEVVQHGTNGLLVPYVEVDALTETIRQALMPGVRERLAANVGVGMDRFDFTHMIDATDAYLRSFLQLT